MGKIEERISHLIADIEELRITAEKSQVAHTMGLKYTQLLDELDLSNKKNLPILVKTSKNGVAAYLEYLRDRVSIIRKVSPATADRLDSQINYHEQLANYAISIFEKAKTPKQLDKMTKTLEFQQRMNELALNALRVQEAVETCYNCLIDTITFLESKTFSTTN